MASVSDVSIEEVSRGKGLTRFLELPAVVHGDDPRFVPPVQVWERYRVARRNPYFERGEVALFLARHAGRPVGRVAAHRAGPGEEGRFGFWTTVDHDDVAPVLVEAAATWLREQGVTTMSGPWSWTAEDEPGALADGEEVPGAVGRPWRPRWETARLERALADLVGAAPVVANRTATWRLPATAGVPALAVGGTAPGQAGSWGDRRLVLDGVAAVPDLSDALRRARIGGAWGLAKRVREGDWESCTIVRCSGAPEVAVPALQAAAGGAGYRWVISPWSPDPDATPETTHHRFSVDL